MRTTSRRSRINAVRHIGTLASAFLAGLMSGCQSYHSLPLNSETAIAPPSLEILRRNEDQVRHPLIAPGPFDHRAELSPDEAAVLAVLANPRLKAIRDEAHIAEAQVIQAGILPNPQLSYGLDFPYGDTTDLINAYGLGLNWEFTSLLARGYNVDSAKSHLASVRLDVAWQEWQVAQAAKLHIYRLASAFKQFEVAKDIERESSANLTVVRKAAALNHITDPDLAAAEDSSRQAHSTYLLLEQEVKTERVELNRALGFPPEWDVRIQSNLELPAMAENTVLQTAELLQGLEDRRLDLLALKKGCESEDANLRAAIRSQFPKINIGLNKARDTSDVRTVGFGVALDLPFFDRNQGRIAIETATRQQLFDEYAARVAEARSDVVRLIAEMDSARRQAETAKTGLPALERLAAAYEKALRQGNTDVLSYYNTRHALAVQRLEVMKLHRDRTDLLIALEIATGRASIVVSNKKAEAK